MKRKFISSALVVLLSVSAAFGSVPFTSFAASEPYGIAAAEEATALEEARQYARDNFQNGENPDAAAVDLDLKNHTFDGTENSVVTYGADSNEMRVLKNISAAGKGGTIIYRFKTTSDGVLFGAGDASWNDGRNMILGVQNRSTGDLRIYFRNQQGAGLKGYLAPGLKDGNWHTAALCMRPGETENTYLVVDGGDNIYPSVWWPSWRPGLNEHTSAFLDFQIGGGKFNSSNFDTMGNFNGSIDFITITDQEYTVAELKELTAPVTSGFDNNFAQMSAAGSKNTWLFTGADATVARFDQLGAVKNYVGFFEDNLRAGGSFVERSRYVYNTAQPGLTVEEINHKYQDLIGKYNPKAVGIMIDRSDYVKGSSGIEAFKTGLRALLDQLYADKRLPMLITPPASSNAEEMEQITAYADAVKEVAGERETKVSDITSLTENYLNEDGQLTALGHQAVANALKASAGISGKNTNYGGFYLQAEPTVINADKAPKVTAADGQLTVKVPQGFEEDTWSYELSGSGQVVKDAGLGTEFTIGGLDPDTRYTLSMTSEGNTVCSRLQDVAIAAKAGSTGTPLEHPDGNEEALPELQSLLTQEEPATYLFMGDSITHGIITSGYNSVPELFEKYLEEQGRIKDVVINSAVSNATLSTTLNQIDHRLNQYNPDVVFIMLGTNDSSVNGERAEGGKGFTVEEYKNYYKELVRDIYQNNPDSYAILRVPCDMTMDAAHSKYKEFFASIYEVESEMKAELPDLKIGVINHMQDWIDYGTEVRNDFMSTSSANTWMVDSVHPNGRGNLRMFQQILKETGLYRNDSVISNYQFRFGDWSDSSNIEVNVICDGSTGVLDMSQLSGYSAGLKEVTLTLRDKKQKSVSRKEAYGAGQSVTVHVTDGFELYTAEVTGKDAETNKIIHFTAKINGKQTGIIYKEVEQSALTGTAESYNSASEGADKALDGDVSTIWHSNYSEAGAGPVINPVTGEYLRNGFTIDLGETRTIGRLDYQPRNNGTNGNILGYQLYYSTTQNGDDFVKIPDGSGVWSGDSSLKSAVFAPLAMRRIQLRALTTMGNTANTFISAAEFRVYTAEEVYPDISDPTCTCTIENLVFDGQNREIGQDAGNTVFTMNASAQLLGDCRVHTEREIGYEYKITQNPGAIGAVSGNHLTMSDAGTVQVTVTASANGKTAEKSASFTVSKKEEPAVYTLSFDACGGSVAVSSMKCTRGESYVTLPIPTRAGYEFQGWFTEVTGGKQIQSGDICDLDRDSVVYAHWKETEQPVYTYTLSFDACGGSVAVSSMKCTRGESYGTLPIPTRAGYRFQGWFTDAAGGYQIRTGDSCNLNADSFAYAHWVKENTQIKVSKAARPSASANKEKSIRITWKKAEYATGYILSRYDAKAKKWTDIKTTSETSYTDKNRNPATVYKYRVMSVYNSGGTTVKGEWSDACVTATKPQKPVLNAKKLSTGKKIKLTWNKKSKADGYELTMKIGKGSYTKLKLKSPKTISYTKAKLKKGKAYTFRLRGYKKAGSSKIFSSYSKERRFKM